MDESTARVGNGLTKMPTGIDGFDDISRGGIPRGRTTLVVGGPGTGKTVFALQTLVEGAGRLGEPGIFVAFEENSGQIIANAASFGWQIAELEKEGALFFLDAHMPSDVFTAGAFDLIGMLASIDAKAKEMGAKRVVFDSIDVLLAMLDDPLAERREIYRVHDWLSKSGLTGLVTARDESAFGPSHRYGFMQFMADCVVLLSNRVEARTALRELRVLKYRGSAFEENAFPMVIGPRGMEVASFAVAAEYPVSTERVSSGVERLDGMLAGGYYRGSSILITGSPGTAKTTMAGAFVEAACRRGEKALYLSFDEAWQEIVRNLASVNIRLQPFVDSGLLRMHSVRSEAVSAEEHLLRLRALLLDHRPACVVVDPLSAMMKAGGPAAAMTVAERLMHITKSHGMTLLTTSRLAGITPETEASQIRVSTIADTWIHLSYLSQAGERNRALTIVKARGIAHSNQVRELVLSDQGVELTDVYTAGGAVLMGTMRMEKEAEQLRERERIRGEIERRRRELEYEEAEVQARMRALERELESRRAELALLQQRAQAREQDWVHREQALRRMRSAEEPTPAGETGAKSPDGG